MSNKKRIIRIFLMTLIISFLSSCGGLGVGLPFDQIFGSHMSVPEEAKDQEEIEQDEDVLDTILEGIDIESGDTSWQITSYKTEEPTEETFADGGAETSAESETAIETSEDEIPNANSVNQEPIDDLNQTASNGSAMSNGLNADEQKGSGPNETGVLNPEPLSIPVTIAKLDKDKKEKVLSWSSDGKSAFVLVSQKAEGPVSRLEFLKNYIVKAIPLVKTAHASNQNDLEDAQLVVRHWDLTTGILSQVKYIGFLSDDPDPSKLEFDGCELVIDQLINTETILRTCQDRARMTLSKALVYDYGQKSIINLIDDADAGKFSARYKMAGHLLLTLTLDASPDLYAFDTITAKSQMVVKDIVSDSISEDFDVSNDGKYLMAKDPVNHQSCYHWDLEANPGRYSSVSFLHEMPANLVTVKTVARDQSIYNTKHLVKQKADWPSETLVMHSIVDCKTVAMTELLPIPNIYSEFEWAGKDAQFLVNFDHQKMLIIDTINKTAREFDNWYDNYKVSISSHDMLIWSMSENIFYYIDLAELDLDFIDGFADLLTVAQRLNGNVSDIDTAQSALSFGLKPFTYSILSKGKFVFNKTSELGYLAQVDLIDKKTLTFIDFYEELISYNDDYRCYFDDEKRGFIGFGVERFARFVCPRRVITTTSTTEADDASGYVLRPGREYYLYDIETSQMYDFNNTLLDCGYINQISSIHGMMLIDTPDKSPLFSSFMSFITDTIQGPSRSLKIIKINLETGECDEVGEIL